MKLKEDVYSTCNKNLYGRAGEEVEMVSERGDLLIVKGEKGRFSVHKSKVDVENSKEEGLRVDTIRSEKDNVPKRQTTRNAKNGKKTKAVGPSAMPTLFD